jgi:hypothetical protein
MGLALLMVKLSCKPVDGIALGNGGACCGDCGRFCRKFCWNLSAGIART